MCLRPISQATQKSGAKVRLSIPGPSAELALAEIPQLKENRPQSKVYFLAEMTRDWLQNHNIDDASEIISYNNELETQLTRAKSEKDELSILNENLSEK